MRRTRVLALLGTAAVLGTTFAVPVAPTGAVVPRFPAAPADQLIRFESDTPGDVPNGFYSVDSPHVSFSDTNGSGLNLANFGGQGEGNVSLQVRSDFDDSGLLILLDHPTSRISLDFGNDDPNFSNPGDEASLTLFRGTTQVAQVFVLLNRNDLMDQSIVFKDGPLFNRAIFKYEINPTVGAIEVVDNIRVGPLCTISGSNNNDILNGTSGNDVICGGPGSDTINGNGGNDAVIGGNGNDIIHGGGGNDYLRGNLGNDTIYGDAGGDTLIGDAGSDKLDGGTQIDFCDGGANTDIGKNCENRVGFP